MSKQELGQFYTTNCETILEGITIPEDVSIIVEPFAGNGDLINFLGDTKYELECYDIEPKQSYITKRDTLKNPPIYTDKFILTNPPYLARNKNPNKEYYDKYNTNDLYKCFLIELIENTPSGGIVIIPTNFLCSIRKSDMELRKRFVAVFDIIKVNIFETQVFDDTSYAICAILFAKKTTETIDTKIIFYPSKITIDVLLTSENNYTVGGEVYNIKPSKKYKIDRLTTRNKDIVENHTNIYLKTIDSNSKNMLCVEYNEERYIDETPRLTARSFATLMITPPIDMDTQQKVVSLFNSYLTEKRTQYNSLFLTNYRDNSDIPRKRISFRLAYNLVGHILETQI